MPDGASGLPMSRLNVSGVRYWHLWSEADIQRCAQSLEGNIDMISRLASLVVLMTLMLAPTSLQAQNSPLTPELMRRMLQVITLKGNDGNVGTGIANPLGLSATGQRWPWRRIGSNATDKLVHVFGVSRGPDQDIVVYVRRPTDLVIFRANRDGKAVTALISNTQLTETTMLSPADAQEKLDFELRFWAKNIDAIETMPAPDQR